MQLVERFTFTVNEFFELEYLWIVFTTIFFIYCFVHSSIAIVTYVSKQIFIDYLMRISKFSFFI